MYIVLEFYTKSILKKSYCNNVITYRWEQQLQKTIEDITDFFLIELLIEKTILIIITACNKGSKFQITGQIQWLQIEEMRHTWLHYGRKYMEKVIKLLYKCMVLIWFVNEKANRQNENWKNNKKQSHC